MGILSSVTAHVPALHPALNPHNHVLPQLHRFLNNGDGLGLHYKSLPLISGKGVNYSDLDASKLYDVVVDFFSYNTVSTAQNGFKSWYMSHDPFNLTMGAAFYLSIFCWIVGEITGNASIVDRLWTFIPLAYTIHYTFYDHIKAGTLTKSFLSYSGSSTSWQENLVPDGVDPRMYLMFLLQLLWCARLTIHAFGRGFFNLTTEDYRWSIVKKRIGYWPYKLLSLTFTAFMQNILFAVMALPQYLLLTARANRHPTHVPPPLGLIDLLLAGAFITILIFEEIGDNQQQEYQVWKRDPKKHGSAGKTPQQETIDRGKLTRGFRTDGLFAWSRHPNFTCEISNYYILYLFTLKATVPKAVFTNFFSVLQNVASKAVDKKSVDTDTLIQLVKDTAPHLINYSILSPLAVTMLFYSSTLLTEQISSSKYPLYREYQKRVAMFWPWYTVVKIVWLGVTARLTKVNHLVFGSGQNAGAKKQKKK